MDISTLSDQFVEFYDKFSSWEHSVLRGKDLSPAQVHTIEVIGHQQDMRMKELAERLGITTGTLTVAVDKLEKKGLVLRKPHKQDRRSWFVVLTEKGREVFEQHHRFHENFTREIAAGLSNEEICMIHKLLGKVLERM